MDEDRRVRLRARLRERGRRRLMKAVWSVWLGDVHTPRAAESLVARL